MAKQLVQMYASRRYEIGHLSDNGGLCFYDDGEKTLEDVRRFIDESNQRVAERGYKPERYCINDVSFHNFFDADGIFLRKEVITNRVEIYPKVLPDTTNIKERGQR